MPINIEKVVSIAIRGIEAANAIPLATDTPILSPVYEPGPLLTATASREDDSIPFSFRMSPIKTVSIDACERLSLLSFTESMPDESQRATEHRFVAVSIQIIIP